MKKIFIFLFVFIFNPSFSQKFENDLSSEQYDILNSYYKNTDAYSLFEQTLNMKYWVYWFDLFDSKEDARYFCITDTEIPRVFLKLKEQISTLESKKISKKKISKGITLKKQLNDKWAAITEPLIVENYAFFYSNTRNEEHIIVLRRVDGRWELICMEGTSTVFPTYNFK